MLGALDKVLKNAVPMIFTLIAGVLLVHFTNIIYKPDVLYTVAGSKISLPEKYEQELSKVRAILAMKNFETVLGGISTKNLSVEAGVTGSSINIKKHELSVVGPNLVGKSQNSLRVEGRNLEKMLEVVKKPETLRALLDPALSHPTAFATIEIYNAGNREATDLEVSIKPNGILVESKVDSSETSAEKWETIFDENLSLPIGIHLPPIKRLPPGGHIRAKVYWHLMGNIGETKKEDEPTVSVKGSFSGGMLQFAENKPYSSANGPLLTSVGVFIALSSFLIGYWIKGYLRSRSQIPP